MKAGEIDSGYGYVITQKGNKEGLIFLTDDKKSTKNSEKAAWFFDKLAAEIFVKYNDPEKWIVVTW